MKMAKKTILYIIALVMATACIEEQPGDNSSIIARGDALPDFSVHTSQGEHYCKDSLEGRRSVIVFFNTSCADCRQELPRVDSLYKALRHDDDFRLICIARDEEQESIEHFWNENGLTMPYSAQNGKKVYNLFAKSIIPRIYISSRDGIVRFVYGDSSMPSFATLMTALDNI